MLTVTLLLAHAVYIHILCLKLLIAAKCKFHVLINNILSRTSKAK